MSAHLEEWPFEAPFRIAGYEFTACLVVVAEIRQGHAIGRGEASGVYYLNDSPRGALEQIHAMRREIEHGLDREGLQRLLPAGGARNALDCALWDLECQLEGVSVWRRAGMEPSPRQTVYTIGMKPEPEDAAEAARRACDFKLLKIKLDDDRPVERVRAIRAARPDCRIVVDANQALSFIQLQEILPEFHACGVEMVEQPLPRGEDEALNGFRPCLPLCADESCLERSELPAAAARYQMINIKLDKTGGLTEALKLAYAAKDTGLELMVGNMGGTSLAAAPGFVIAQLCALVDLDGPFGLKTDRLESMTYRDGLICEPEPPFWGQASASAGYGQKAPLTVQRS